MAKRAITGKWTRIETHPLYRVSERGALRVSAVADIGDAARKEKDTYSLLEEPEVG